jgi:hypothetical protein
MNSLRVSTTSCLVNERPHVADYFSLDPLGVGMDEVECFPSYLCRLAQIHGVTLHEFCAHLARWWSLHGDGEELPAQPLYDIKSTQFCGAQPRLSRYLKALDIATGSKHIERTTFIAIAPAMSTRSAGFLKKDRSWCPACFREHLISETTVYDRLIWCLAPIQRCNFHRVELISCCPRCSTRQHQYHRSGDLSLCFKCEFSLCSDQPVLRFRRRPCFGELDCTELVSAISTGKLQRAEEQAFKTFFLEVDKLFAATLERPMPLGMWETIVHVRKLSKSGKVPSLNFPTMLRHCAGTGVRLIDVMTSPLEAARTSGWLFPIEDIRCKGARHHSASFHRRVSDLIKGELSKPAGERIMSYRAMTLELGVSDGYLRYRFPGLARRYKKRFRFESLISEQTEKAKIRTFFQSRLALYPSAEFPSQDHLVAAAKEACGCGVRKARIVLNLLLREKRLSQRSGDSVSIPRKAL